MSMLGMAFLNEISSKGQFDNAAQVLDQLRKQIVVSLHQTGQEGGSKDGMDISFCIFEKDNSKLQFAGAFNSGYIIRNGEIIEANADRMPIGFHDRVGEPFTNHEIELQKGDTIYILSDGYIDQFGGENRKKFMARRFKNLLVDIQTQTMAQQKDFLHKTLIDWRGELDQVDDIMVIGMRV